MHFIALSYFILDPFLAVNVLQSRSSKEGVYVCVCVQLEGYLRPALL
jgi:hypothetical protein